MKSLIKFAVIPLFMLSACTSAYHLSSAYDDDGVYSSKKEKALDIQPQVVAEKQNPVTIHQKSQSYKEVTPDSYTVR